MSYVVDPNDTFERMKKSVTEKIQQHLQVTGNQRSLRVSNVQVEDKLDPSDISGQLDALLHGSTWGAPVVGDVELIDNKTGTILDRAKRARIAVLPKLTPRFSVIVDGTERIVRNQLRLRPGVYTVAGPADTMKSQINTSKGTGKLSILFDPRKTVWSLSVNRAKSIPMFDVMKVLGVSEDRMKQVLGEDVFNQLRAKSKPEWTTNQLHTSLFPKVTDQLTNEQKNEAIKLYFEKGTAVAPDVTAITLGKPYSAVNGELMLATVKKQVDINRGKADFDERDSLVFKQIQMLDDHLANRVEAQLNPTKRNGVAWHRRAKSRVDRSTNARDALRRMNPGKELTSFFTIADEDDEGGLAESSGLTNPARQLDVYTQTTLTGPGGTDVKKITDVARSVHPSTLGLLDPVHTPEGGKVGVDTHLTVGVKRLPGGDIAAEFINARTGARERLTAAQQSQLAIGMPNQWDLTKGKPRPLMPEVFAIRKAKQGIVKANAVDYIFPDMRLAYDFTLNMVPFLDSVDGARGVMAAKMMGQAISLVDKEREAPLVQTESLSGTSWEREVASMHLPKSPAQGTVVRITSDYIAIKGSGNKVHRVGLYNYFPLLGKAGPMHHNIVKVKVGDKVSAGQILADSNFTKDGTLALGKNLSVAYMAYKGYNFEDGLVVSESAAKKMTSQHLHADGKILREPGMIFSRDRWRALFPSLWKAHYSDTYDENGVIKEGKRVQPGEPLVLAARKREERDMSSSAAQIRRMLIHPYRNASVLYEHDNPGVVHRVVANPREYKVHVYAEHPLRVGDKLAGRYGNKGIVSLIVPDGSMPHGQDGKPIDIIMNPLGVPGRINSAQTFETAVGKVGKTYVVKNFTKGSNVDRVEKYLKDNGVSDIETVTDPTTGRKIPEIMVGKQYVMKLEHEAETKAGSRGYGGYNIDQRPGGSKESHPQKIDHLTQYALLAHGARANLRDMATYKATKSTNDELWTAIVNGESIPQPPVPWVWGKFTAMLKQLGVNASKNQDEIRLQPLTDNEVMEMSSGEIREARLITGQNPKAEKGGLFDPAITGGMTGEKWGHVRLIEPIPNPTFEASVNLLLGIKQPQYEGLLSGTLGVRDGAIVAADQAQKLRGEAFRDLLSRINVPATIESTRAELRKTKDASQRDKLYRKLRVLQNLQHLKVSPEKAFLIQNVPIMPPIYRPVFPVPGASTRTSPINYLYKDAINLNNKLKEAKAAGLPDTLPDFQKGMTDLYRSVAAIQGYADPLTQGKKYKGIMEVIAGSIPKRGFFQDKMIKKKQDLSGRGPLVNAPELGLDEVGIPRSIAWDMFKPFVMQELVRMGHTPAKALEEWKNRTSMADRALDVAASKRPVWINRAPSLHRHSILAFKPRLWTNTTIGLHPFVYAGFNADVDGDTLAIHVPVTHAAVEESKQFFPSLHPFGVTKELLTKPSKDTQWGLWLMTQKGKDTTHSFGSIPEAMKAYNQQKIAFTDGIRIAGKETTLGRSLVNKVLDEAKPGMSKPDISMDSKTTKAIVTEVARTAPKSLAGLLNALKDMGYQAVFEMGGTLSLRDLKPISKDRDALLEDARKQVKGGKDLVEAYEPAIKKIQAAIRGGDPKNQLVSMLQSGAISKVNAVQALVGAPVLYIDNKGAAVRTPVRNSFVEGLEPHEYWTSMYGARKGIMGRAKASQKPGELAKDIAQTMMDALVTRLDCGTDRGVLVSTSGIDALGRYPAVALPTTPTSDSISMRALETMRKQKVAQVLVRSPLTCLVGKGVCAKCWGDDEGGKLPKVGDNVGVRSGTAITEPAMQLSLSAFHTGGIYGAAGLKDDTFLQVRNLLDVPKNFRQRATIATVAGKVEKITDNPRGGWDIWINGTKHYVVPKRKIREGLVGKDVVIGEELTDGFKDPRELVKLVGLQATQEYMAEALAGVLGTAVNVPRSHVEMVVRQATGPVQIIDDPTGKFEPGQTVPFGVVEQLNHEKSVVVPAAQAAGHTLLDRIKGFEHLQGKVLSPQDAKQLTGHRVRVTPKSIRFEPLFPGVQHLHEKKDDWLARLAYRGLKPTIQLGAAQGFTSKLHGLHPTPGWVYGQTISPIPGPKGEY